MPATEQNAIPTLYGITISPWSIKARWALDWHGLPYRWKEWVTVLTPLLLAPRLRKKARAVSAPLLLALDSVRLGAWEIALHADRGGSGARLLPDERDIVEHWDAVANRLAEAGRALMMTRMLTDRAGQLAALPDVLPDILTERMRFMARHTAVYLSKKYGFRLDAPDHYREAAVAWLEEVRAALGRSPSGGTLLPRFSYADMAVAAALQLVRPVDARFVPMVAGTRDLWTDAYLATTYWDVLTWRDEVFERYWRGAAWGVGRNSAVTPRRQCPQGSEK